MNAYTHLIWDFNGTLYDDVDASIESANRLLTAHGLAPIGSRAQYRALFGFPIIDYYRRMGFDFAKTPYDALAHEWVPYYLDAAKDCGLFPDAIPTLERLRELGISHILLSATEQEMLNRQVTALGLLPHLDALLGQGTIHAHGKREVALAWKAEHPDARLLLVGDTDHDAEVAAALGADCILLTTGHQSSEILRACRPILLAETLSEVAAFLEGK